MDDHIVSESMRVRFKNYLYRMEGVGLTSNSNIGDIYTNRLREDRHWTMQLSDHSKQTREQQRHGPMVAKIHTN